MTANEMLERLKKSYPDSIVNVLSDDDVHFNVVVESKVFTGLSRIEQHQHVMKVFDAELKSGEVHALSLKTKST
ncbi:MAG: BolA/IbaG family iron-sulfur metabolism protein [Bdellovibrionaceae bacterium]|nr:BolA/IbaG family iron-sulfur metabolism protein [Pseudobdellovibrionaceae bacterium]